MRILFREGYFDLSECVSAGGAVRFGVRNVDGFLRERCFFDRALIIFSILHSSSALSSPIFCTIFLLSIAILFYLSRTILNEDLSLSSISFLVQP